MVSSYDQLALQPLELRFDVALAEALHGFEGRDQLAIRLIHATHLHVGLDREHSMRDLVRSRPGGAVASQARLQKLRGLGTAAGGGECPTALNRGNGGEEHEAVLGRYRQRASGELIYGAWLAPERMHPRGERQCQRQRGGV